MLNHVTVFYLLILSSLTTIAVSEFESGETAGHSRDYELLHSSDAWEKMLDAWKQQHHQDWTTNRARRTSSPLPLQVLKTSLDISIHTKQLSSQLKRP